jgi:Zn-dependent protease with chaperone function
VSDALVVAVLATATAWWLGLLLEAAARTSRGVKLVRHVFGSVRGALFLPVSGALVVLTAMSMLHHSQGLAAESSQLSGDSDGCIHWLKHAPSSGLDVAPFAASIVSLILLFRCVRALSSRSRRNRTLVTNIDRSLTRQLRALAGSNSGELVYAVTGIEGSGPLAATLGARGLVLIPAADVRSSSNREELLAIVHHERSHLTRRHLRRRFWFEGVFSFWLPRTLMRRVLLTARAEEEWEADGDAALALGSRVLVARSVVNAAERTSRMSSSAGIFAFAADRHGLGARVHRLVAAVAPIPFRIGRAAGPAALFGFAVFAALWMRPEWSIWVFCQVEDALGVACG